MGKTGPLAIMIVLWEIALALLYGFFLGFQQTTLIAGLSTGDQIFYLAIVIIMFLVGFGLLASYIAPSGITGIAFTALIFGLTLQNYFLYKLFWERANIAGFDTFTGFVNERQPKLNLVSESNFLGGPAFGSFSYLDAIGCSMSIYVVFMALVGRINALGIFILTLFMPIFFECNLQLFVRFYIPDQGYGVRAFVFGGVVALIATIIVGRRQQTRRHPSYSSNYRIQSQSLLGALIIWCTYPFFALSDLTSFAPAGISALFINRAALMNIIFALCASILGSFTASAFTYRKFMLHDIVFTIVTGAIAFQVSSDLHFSPAGPLAIGFGHGLLLSLFHSAIKKYINKNGIIESNSVIFNFLIAGVMSSVWAAIYQSTDSRSLGGQSIPYRSSARGAVQQGAYQIVGLALSIGFGILAGLLVGILLKLTDGHTKQEMFRDETIFQLKKTHTKDPQNDEWEKRNAKEELKSGQ